MKKCKKLLAWSMVLMLSLGMMGNTVFADEVDQPEILTETETEIDISEMTETEEETEVVVETEAETETEAVIETETETETEAVVETEAETETEAVVETEAETETEAVVETEAETETEAVAETETEEDEVELMAVGQVTGLKATSGTAGVQLTWTAVTGATGYKITRLGSDGKYHLVHSEKTLTWTDANAATNKYSSYKVYAYKSYSNGTVIKGANSTAVKGIRKLKAVENLKASSRYNGVRLTWTKKSAATGYKIYGTRYGGKYQLIATVTDANYVDIKAPIEGKSSYVVYPYVLVDGSKVVGAKSVTVKAAKAYFYSSAAPTVTKDKVTISPYSFYYDSTNSRYVAECYIINGRSAKVSDISIGELTFSTGDGVVLCSRNFGAIKTTSIDANKKVTYKFYFPAKYIKSYRGSTTLNWYSKITYTY